MTEADYRTCPKRKRMVEQITCQHCGKLVMVNKYRKRRFCSSTCGVHATRGPRTKRITRKLTDLESVPNRPLDIRNVNQRGYVRLFWKVARATYVWCYEHRLAAGLPVGFHVHHKDGNKGNNDPSNLEVLSHSSHLSLHGLAKRDWNVEIAAYLNSQGWQYKTLAICAGVNPTTMLRGIRKYRESHHGYGRCQDMPTLPQRGRRKAAPAY